MQLYTPNSLLAEAQTTTNNPPQETDMDMASCILALEQTPTLHGRSQQLFLVRRVSQVRSGQVNPLARSHHGAGARSVPDGDGTMAILATSTWSFLFQGCHLPSINTICWRLLQQARHVLLVCYIYYSESFLTDKEISGRRRARQCSADKTRRWEMKWGSDPYQTAGDETSRFFRLDCDANDGCCKA